MGKFFKNKKVLVLLAVIVAVIAFAYMLRMEKIEEIHKLYNVENKSLREIVDITGYAFETVQKYAYMKNFKIYVKRQLI